jgi:hypothetical protein
VRPADTSTNADDITRSLEQPGRGVGVVLAPWYCRYISSTPPEQTTEQAVEEVVEQTVEIEEVVADALDLLDQVRYSLSTLEERLNALAKVRKRAQTE